MELVTAQHSESGGPGLGPHGKHVSIQFEINLSYASFSITRDPELYFTRLANVGHAKWYNFYHAVLTLLTIMMLLI